MKNCTKCNKTLALENFDTDNRSKDKHSSKCKLCRSVVKQQYRGTPAGRFKSALTAALRRSKKKQITFNLTLSDLEELWEKQSGKCYYTNFNILLNSNTPYTLSIERLNNEYGYTKDNCVLTTLKANYMKNSDSLETTKQFCLAFLLHNHAVPQFFQ